MMRKLLQNHWILIMCKSMVFKLLCCHDYICQFLSPATIFSSLRCAPFLVSATILSSRWCATFLSYSTILWSGWCAKFLICATIFSSWWCTTFLICATILSSWWCTLYTTFLSCTTSSYLIRIRFWQCDRNIIELFLG